MADDSLALQRRAPPRGRDDVSLGALIFGLGGAPAAWNLQLLICVGLSGHACYPAGAPLATPLWGGLTWYLAATSGVAIVVSLLALAVALASWRATRNDTGNGRACFMALAGVYSSGLFLLATVVSTYSFLLGPLCGG